MVDRRLNIPELSAYGTAVLRAINMALDKIDVPVADNYFSYDGVNVASSSLLDPSAAHKRRNLFRALKCSNRLIEVGFDFGYSALLALDCHPGLSYIGIDAGESIATTMCAAIIQAAYPGRCHFLFGNPSEIICNIAMAGTVGTVDVIYVNGLRDALTAQSSVLGALKLVKTGGLVLVSDKRPLPIQSALDDVLRKGLCSVEDFRGSWEDDEGIAIRSKKSVVERPPISVVYSAVGQHHVREAAISAWSAKRWMPDAITVLVSDQNVSSPHFNKTFVVPPFDKDASRAAKIGKAHAIRCAETEQVLYVDSDTYFVADVRPVFNDRESFEIAAVHDTWQYPEIYRKINNGMPYFDPPDSEPFFNSGVIFLNKSAKIDEFLDRWICPFANNSDIKLEQMLFREAIYSSNLSTRVLPSTFNARIGEPNFFSGRIKIAHRRLGSLVQWSTSVPFITAFLNQYTFNRLWDPVEGRMQYLDMEFNQGWVSIADFSGAEEEKFFLAPNVTLHNPSEN